MQYVLFEILYHNKTDKMPSIELRQLVSCSQLKIIQSLFCIFAYDLLISRSIKEWTLTIQIEIRSSVLANRKNWRGIYYERLVVARSKAHKLS